MAADDPHSDCSTIHELVALQARLTPDAVAVVAHNNQWTYQDLDTWSDRIACQLLDLGITVETRVAVAIPRSFAFQVAALAVLKAGGAYVPLDPAYPEERRAFMLSDCSAEVLITVDSEVSPPGASPRTLIIDPFATNLAGVDRPFVPVRGDNLAYVIYTSGSTGTPKGVEISHESVLQLIRGDERLAVAPGDVVAQLTSTSFDPSTFEVWAALCNGGRVAVLTETDNSIEELGTYLRAHRPDWLVLSAGVFHLLVDHDAAALESVGTMMAGGDVVSPQHTRAAARRVRRTAFASYGPTETTVFESLHTIDPAAELDRVPLGQPLHGKIMHVLDGGLRPVADGAVGEIYLSGAGLARGYHRQPALTAERFVPDPFSGVGGARLYRTGDLGRVLASGEIEFHGRVDRQVKIRGFRVEPGELEAALNAHGSISAAAVAVMPDPDGIDKRLVAYVSAVRSATLSITGLQEWLAQRLPAYLLPTDYVVLEQLPLNPNGKVDREALPAPWRARDDLDHLELPPYVPPATDVERVIAEAFREVLILDRVGTRDNFFRLGGDSLRGMHLLGKLRTQGISLTSREFSANSTVAELAAIVLDSRDAMS